MAITRLLSVEDFEALGAEAERYELVDGVLREVPPMGGRHGEVQVEILVPLAAFVKAHRLGRLYTEGTHFVIRRDPPLILMPDIAFVRAERLPPPPEREGIMRLPPDLAVEVASPNDRPGEVRQKIAEYVDAGVRLVWHVQPRRRAVTVYAPGQAPVTLGESDVLDGGEVLPGFTLPVSEFFR